MGIELPLVPIRVEVPYWKIKPEYEGKYHYRDQLLRLEKLMSYVCIDIININET